MSYDTQVVSTKTRKIEKFIMTLSLILMIIALARLYQINIFYNSVYDQNKRLIKENQEMKEGLDCEKTLVASLYMTTIKQMEIINNQIKITSPIEKEIKKKRLSVNIRKLKINAYTSSVKECGKKNGFTAISKKLAIKKNFPRKAIPWETAAVGDDCLYLMGKTILVNIYGKDLLLKVNDKKKEGRTGIDICVRTVEEAKDVGTGIGDVRL